MNDTPNITRRRRIGALAPRVIVALLALLLVNVSFDAGATDPDGWLSRVDYEVGPTAHGEAIKTQIIADIDAARVRVEGALSHLHDEDIAEALVRAHKRGVRVRLVSDVDHRTGSPGFELLEDNGIEPVYGDGELRYLPEPTLTPLLEECQDRSYDRACTRGPTNRSPQPTDGLMIRRGSFNLMSHTFLVIDEIKVWNVATPLIGADSTFWLGWRAMSEPIARSFEREFRQMHGGVFSTTLSVYNGPLKSITQSTPLYYTDKGPLRIQFNPQERLVKNVIDEVYRAKASVFIMTEEITNPFLLDALEYKRDNGFKVEVLVSARQDGGRMRDRVMALGARQAPASVDHLPTVVVIDQERDRTGQRRPRIAQVLSHPLWRSAAYETRVTSPNDQVFIYPADTFIDGNMWEILEQGSYRNPEIDRIAELFRTAWNAAN